MPTIKSQITTINPLIYPSPWCTDNRSDIRFNQKVPKPELNQTTASLMVANVSRTVALCIDVSSTSLLSPPTLIFVARIGEGVSSSSLCQVAKEKMEVSVIIKAVAVVGSSMRYVTFFLFHLTSYITILQLSSHIAVLYLSSHVAVMWDGVTGVPIATLRVTHPAYGCYHSHPMALDLLWGHLTIHCDCGMLLQEFQCRPQGCYCILLT